MLPLPHDLVHLDQALHPASSERKHALCHKLEPIYYRIFIALMYHRTCSVNQSINLLKSFRGIEFALSIRARDSQVNRLTKIKEIKLSKR